MSLEPAGGPRARRPSAPRGNHAVADAVEHAPEAMEADIPHCPGRHLPQHRAVRTELMEVRIGLDGNGAGYEREDVTGQNALRAAVHVTDRKGAPRYGRRVHSGAMDQPVVEQDGVPGLDL